MHDNLIQKQNDPASRLEALLDNLEPQFSREFIRLINTVRDNIDLDEISRLVEAGRIQEAVDEVTAAMSRFSDIVITAVVASGQDTAEFLEEALSVFVSFDQTNTRAVNEMRDSRLRLIREITASQRDAIRETLVDGIRRGINPRQQAREFRNSIGLTQRQIQAVNSYRRALESGSLAALRRQLRDRRFDGAIRRSIRDREPLTQEHIDRFVQRYSERLLAFRANTIARTEALRAVHQGSALMYQQAVEAGTLDADRLLRTWITAGDARVRDSHNGMNGQTQPGLPEANPFISDAGNQLRYPGDINAPGS